MHRDGVAYHHSSWLSTALWGNSSGRNFRRNFENPEGISKYWGILQNSSEYGGILQNPAVFSKFLRIRRDFAKFFRIWRYFAKSWGFFKIPPKTEGFSKILPKMEVFCKILRFFQNSSENRGIFQNSFEYGGTLQNPESKVKICLKGVTLQLFLCQNYPVKQPLTWLNAQSRVTIVCTSLDLGTVSM